MKDEEEDNATSINEKLDQIDVSNRILQQTAHEQHREFSRIEKLVRDLRKLIKQIRR